MKKRLIALTVFLLSLLAYANIAVASNTHGYQPEIPAKFKK